MGKIKLNIDGRTVSVREGSTVLKAIGKAGLYVPTLCDDPALKPFGACRLCIVEIEGMRGLPTACTTPAQEGMKVHTETGEIQRIRRTIVELAIANHPYECLFCKRS
ncbi:MAG: 2Fe-2S iron-sulfur cluster-binding protein, partial [Pseudomonadota bacterium]